jgi:hypothetical protein
MKKSLAYDTQGGAVVTVSETVDANKVRIQTPAVYAFLQRIGDLVGAAAAT